MFLSFERCTLRCTFSYMFVHARGHTAADTAMQRAIQMAIYGVMLRQVKSRWLGIISEYRSHTQRCINTKDVTQTCPKDFPDNKYLSVFFNRMLPVGGLLVLDDLVGPAAPAVHATIRFIEANLPFARLPLHRMEPPRLAYFRKVRADDRAWSHYEPFDAGLRA